MAKKPSRRRMTRAELRQPDEVMSGLQRAFDWITRYRYPIIGGVAVVVVIVIGVTVWQATSRSQAMEVSADLGHALDVVGGVVVPEDQETDRLEQQGVAVYPTQEAKFKEAHEKLQEFLSKHEGSDLGELAKALDGAALYELADFKKTVELVGAYVESHPDSPILPVLHQELGMAKWALGQPGEAVPHFQKLTEASDWWFKTHGHMHMGDAQSPIMLGDAGDKGKAVAAYNEAIAAIPADQPELTVAQKFLKKELEKRISMLQ